MQTILIKNARVIDPESRHHERKVDILIDNKGHIAKIAKGGSLKAAPRQKTLSHAGLHVSPGWVDMQVQLHDPGFEWKEDLNALANAAVKGGYTRILCHPNTLPVIDNSQMVHALQSRIAHLPVSLMLAGALSQHAEGKELAELYDMHQAGAIAFTDGDKPLQSPGLLLRALQYMLPFEGLMIHYPFDQGLAAEGQANEGKHSTMLGLKGIPNMSETLAVSRLISLLDYAPGRVHLQPLSCSKSFKQLQSLKTQFPELSAGITAYQLAFDDSVLIDFDSSYKVMPPIRDKAEVKSLRQALKKGWIDIICSGHNAQGLEEKQKEFNQADWGMLGLQTCFVLAYDQLVKAGFISIDQLIRMISIRPREILRLPSRSVAVGEEAELSFFCPGQDWTFSQVDLYSRASNSPLLDQTFGATVLGTYHNGKLQLATQKAKA